MGSHYLLQGIFATQRLNPGLLYCRRILYHLSCQRSPVFTHREPRPPPEQQDWWNLSVSWLFFWDSNSTMLLKTNHRFCVTADSDSVSLGARSEMYISYKLPLTVVPGTLLECGDIACTAKQKWYSGQGREVIRIVSCDQDRALNTEFFNLEIAVEIMLEAVVWILRYEEVENDLPEALQPVVVCSHWVWVFEILILNLLFSPQVKVSTLINKFKSSHFIYGRKSMSCRDQGCSLSLQP